MSELPLKYLCVLYWPTNEIKFIFTVHVITRFFPLFFCMPAYQRLETSYKFLWDVLYLVILLQYLKLITHYSDFISHIYGFLIFSCPLNIELNHKKKTIAS